MTPRDRLSFSLRELSGALGDLGTLLPLMLASIAVVGLAPVPVVLGFALSYVATAAWYRLPIPVQPMKAVAAVLLTAQMTPETLAASGLMIGTVLLLLGVTGWIDRLGRLAQSVLAGLQLGLGLALALVSFELMAGAPVIGLATLAILGALLLVPGCPAALIAVIASVVLGQVLGVAGMTLPQAPSSLPALVGLPSWQEIERGFAIFVLPQLSLTLTNAILLTALVAGDYFGDRARHVTPRRLAVSTGLGNLLLTPFGALPMCHGAGGVAAHHRFGARTGAAPLMLGLILFGLALLPGGAGIAALTLIPVAGLGAMLLVASAELALSRRLFDCKPSCWPVIAVAAGVTLFADPFWGLVAGSLAELLRVGVVRALRRRRERR